MDLDERIKEGIEEGMTTNERLEAVTDRWPMLSLPAQGIITALATEEYTSDDLDVLGRIVFTVAALNELEAQDAVMAVANLEGEAKEAICNLVEACT